MFFLRKFIFKQKKKEFKKLLPFHVIVRSIKELKLVDTICKKYGLDKGFNGNYDYYHFPACFTSEENGWGLKGNRISLKILLKFK